MILLYIVLCFLSSILFILGIIVSKTQRQLIDSSNVISTTNSLVNDDVELLEDQTKKINNIDELFLDDDYGDVPVITESSIVEETLEFLDEEEIL